VTQAELYAALAIACPTDDGYVPVAYRAHEPAVEPPFICYLFTDSADVTADDTNYVPIAGFDVEYYSETKDLAAEAEIEAALASLGLVWSKTETYIETEKLIETIWSVQAVL